MCTSFVVLGPPKKFIIMLVLLKCLTMVYNAQNYWVFGLFPSSGILENRIPDDGKGPKTQKFCMLILL
jgi:hypothetical protein